MIATKLFEEVLQIKLSRYAELIPGTVVSAYWVDDLLIDSGPAHTTEELTEFLKDKSITAVVNTHHHEDHIGANEYLRQRFGVDLYAHPLAVEKINRPASLYPYQEEVWGYPLPSRVNPLKDSITTNKFHWEVIPTPGHDRDHICLFEAQQGWLFSGDLVVGRKPVVCRPMDDQWQILADLKTIRALKPRFLFPAPGEVVVEPGVMLDQLINHLEELGGRIDTLHKQGLEPAAIVKEIFGRENPMAERTQNQFSSENLVRSFLKGNHP
ncbi:MAG: MBL fold metallo-hydrolase [Thermodesulfobacteriota bacterium]